MVDMSPTFSGTSSDVDPLPLAVSEMTLLGQQRGQGWDWGSKGCVGNAHVRLGMQAGDLLKARYSWPEPCSLGSAMAKLAAGAPRLHIAKPLNLGV